MELTPIPAYHTGGQHVTSSTPAFKQRVFTEADARASLAAKQQQQVLDEIERSNRTNALFQGLEVTPGSYARSVAKSQYSGQPNVIGNLADQELSDPRDLTDPNDLS